MPAVPAVFMTGQKGQVSQKPSGFNYANTALSLPLSGLLLLPPLIHLSVQHNKHASCTQHVLFYSMPAHTALLQS